jgi:hypothetical protein
MPVYTYTTLDDPFATISTHILRNTSTGGLEVHDINSNQITGAAFMGTVGLDSTKPAPTGSATGVRWTPSAPRT